jgi:hypothetical protein
MSEDTQQIGLRRKQSNQSEDYSCKRLRFANSNDTVVTSIHHNSGVLENDQKKNGHISKAYLNIEADLMKLSLWIEMVSDSHTLFFDQRARFESRRE